MFDQRDGTTEFSQLIAVAGVEAPCSFLRAYLLSTEAVSVLRERGGKFL